MAGSRDRIVAALDVGSRKICCFIARISDDPQYRPRVIGSGHQISNGVKLGTVVDMEETETSIRAAVDTAERMAGGTPIDDVVVNISAGQPLSKHFSVDVDVAGHEIGQMDIDRVLSAGRAEMQDEERCIIHSRPTDYAIDGVGGVKDPRGMFGERLAVNMHISSVALSPLRNLQSCINRCHLNMSSVVLSPYASGLSTLVADERELGSILIDMGGGMTTVAAFKDNEFLFADVVPFGGNHVTSDIAQGLSVSLSNAERLKTLFGKCIPQPMTDRDPIDIRQTGDGGEEFSTTIPRGMLTSIIQPRVEEILELVRDKIVSAGMDRLAGRRLVFTGGASQIAGLEELAAKVFHSSSSGENNAAGKYHLRLGRPLNVDGLGDAVGTPEFSTCAGLLGYMALQPKEVHFIDNKQPMVGYFARIGQWIRENF